MAPANDPTARSHSPETLPDSSPEAVLASSSSAENAPRSSRTDSACRTCRRSALGGRKAERAEKEVEPAEARAETLWSKAWRPEERPAVAELHCAATCAGRGAGAEAHGINTESNSQTEAAAPEQDTGGGKSKRQEAEEAPSGSSAGFPREGEVEGRLLDMVPRPRGREEGLRLFELFESLTGAKLFSKLEVS